MYLLVQCFLRILIVYFQVRSSTNPLSEIFLSEFDQHVVAENEIVLRLAELFDQLEAINVF